MEELNKFSFWCPIEKSEDLDPTTGEQVMKLGGIASTSDEDSDGEFLDPKGFDIKPLLESGVVNWHHQAKGQPGAIIGEPIKAEIRPQGLYIETKLYPSSKIACDVWELAKTLEKDSKNRRLGYSIEGKVVKRKSDDMNSPDYKKIEKAIITGVAITHQPKNPKTFANIIKGEIDDDFAEDSVEQTSSTKIRSFSKSEVMEKIFKDVAGINIEKAEKVYTLIKNIANMGKQSKKIRITDEDISKAYEALGLNFDQNDINKGCDDDDFKKKVVEKSKNNDPDDYDEEPEDDEGEDDDDEPGADEDEEEDEDEMKKSSSVKKAGIGSNRFDRIEKAIATSHHLNTKYVKALGVMIKDASDKLRAAAEREEELLDIVKSQEDTISELSEKIEMFGSEVPAPKSISSVRTIERRFAKGEEDELNKGNDNEGLNVVSMSKNPSGVAEILDQATFAKGYDDEFSKACTTFEASKTLSPTIVARIEKEFGYKIVK